MSFAYPWLLPLGLLAVVLTTWLLRRAEGARRAALAAFGEVEVLRRSSTLEPPGSGSPRSALVCWHWPVRSWASARAKWCARGGTSCCCSISPDPWE